MRKVLTCLVVMIPVCVYCRAGSGFNITNPVHKSTYKNGATIIGTGAHPASETPSLIVKLETETGIVDESSVELLEGDSWKSLVPHIVVDGVESHGSNKYKLYETDTSSSQLTERAEVTITVLEPPESGG